MCEPCITCEAKTICDACVPDGEWKHLGGIIPCQPSWDNSDLIGEGGADANKVQRDRFKLRDDK
jgi:hypothetical protein